MKRLVLLFCLVSVPAWAGQTTIGDEGINSKVTLLDGSGIDIAQIEVDGRSGWAGYDAANSAASNTVPTGVYWSLQSGMDPNSQNGGRITNHATAVANIMIGNASKPEYEGVAPAAHLYSIGFENRNEEATVMAMNRMATLPKADIKAINMSWGATPRDFIEGVDGNSLFTQYVDWSARQHDILYVVSWPNDNPEPALPNTPNLPTDEYNGITVAGLSSTFALFRVLKTGLRK